MRLQAALLDALQGILHERPGGLSEHELMRALAEGGNPDFRPEDFADPLSLFQSHFLLFHHLYRLRDRLWEDGAATLEIHCLNIRLIPSAPGQASGLPAGRDGLRDYYLDLRHLAETGKEEVEALLDGFWRRYLRQGRRAEALAVLELSDPVDFDTIRRQYRLLAMRHHPDRGGDEKRFQELAAAMEALSAGPKSV
ncbi:MAG: DnaJ domain-containing protein [Sulfuricellaceae bacterium]|nr:DnaJ domain-containing protein [Sulfuricellaceae bacterium]